MIAVRRDDIAAFSFRIESVIAHDAPESPGIDDHTAVAEFGRHAAVSITVESGHDIADLRHRRVFFGGLDFA